MSLFKKLLLGTAIASALLFTLPSEQAQAASATLSKKFYYENLDGQGWEYHGISGTDPYLVSTSNSEYLAVSYLQFLVDPAVANAQGALSLTIHSVSTDPDTTPGNPPPTGTLSIYRVNDQAVFDAPTGTLSPSPALPIDLDTLLATQPIVDGDNAKPLTFDFSSLISSASLLGDSESYLSFAIVSNVDVGTLWIRAEQNPASINLSVETPAPEPMSAAYMLIGAGALALRRVKRVLGLA